MTSVIGKLRWSVAHRGIGGTVQAAAKSIGRKLQPPPPRAIHPFDLEHGTDTGGLIVGSDLTSGHPSDRFIEGYAAVPPGRFRAMLARWQAGRPPLALAGLTFVDLGCGKGRAVLLASELGFRGVVGVEINPGLAAIAQANTALWTAAGKAHCPIRIEQADAAEFVWPAGPCVVFLFNPFGAAILERVVESMLTHFRHSGADLDVLYHKPEQAAAFRDGFNLLWCEAIPIDPEELAADPAPAPGDMTCAYRIRGAIANASMSD